MSNLFCHVQRALFFFSFLKGESLVVAFDINDIPLILILLWFFLRFVWPTEVD